MTAPDPGLRLGSNDILSPQSAAARPPPFSHPGPTERMLETTDPHTPAEELDPTDTPMLFTPFTLRGVTTRNRIVASPMCQYHSDDGGPTDWHTVHIGRLALGGCGIVFCEDTAVEPEGRKTYACAGLYKDAHVPAYRKLTDLIRSHGGVPAMQLGHSGRQASCHTATRNWRPLTDEDAKDGFAPWQAIAPSALPDQPRQYPPREMDRDDIRRVVELYRVAALRTAEAGFDIVEVHGGHGYLIHQFLSPLSNHRTDAYGGDLQGRMRFALEIAEAVRDAWPADKPLFFRVSAVDGKGGVWNLSDTLVLSKALKDIGVDLIDVSSGGMSGDTDMPIVPRVADYQTGFSERIRTEIDIPTMAVGGITEAHQAESIVQQGKADLCALARELLWNSNWPVHAAEALGLRDPYQFLPEEFAFRLRMRARQGTMEINQGGDASKAAFDQLLGR